MEVQRAEQGGRTSIPACVDEMMFATKPISKLNTSQHLRHGQNSLQYAFGCFSVLYTRDVLRQSRHCKRSARMTPAAVLSECCCQVLEEAGHSEGRMGLLASLLLSSPPPTALRRTCGNAVSEDGRSKEPCRMYQAGPRLLVEALQWRRQFFLCPRRIRGPATLLPKLTNTSELLVPYIFARDCENGGCMRVQPRVTRNGISRLFATRIHAMR